MKCREWIMRTIEIPYSLLPYSRTGAPVSICYPNLDIYISLSTCKFSPSMKFHRIRHDFIHFNDRPFNRSSLKYRLEKAIFNPSNPELPRFLEAIDCCNQLYKGATKTTNYDDIEAVAKLQALPQLQNQLNDNNSSVMILLHKVLEKSLTVSDIQKTRQVLKHHFVTPMFDHVPLHHTIGILKQYTDDVTTRLQIPLSALDLQLIYIPLRKILMRGNVKQAFQIVDSTVTSHNHIVNSWRQWRFNYILATSLMSLTAFTGLSVSGLLGLTAAALTSFASSIVLSSTALNLASSIKINSASRVRWRPGVWINEKIGHIDEVNMVSRIIQGFDELVDINVGNYHLKGLTKDQPRSKELDKFITSQLKKRKLRRLETPQELMFNEYWITAGEKFQWVEPDQDPTDLWLRD